MGPSPREVTQMLMDWSHGDQAALENLMPVVCHELDPLSLSMNRIVARCFYFTRQYDRP